MITLICDWLHMFFEVTPEDLNPTIAINDMHEIRIKK